MKSQVIAFEGASGIGKSTTAKLISEALNYPLVPTPQHPRERSRNYENWSSCASDFSSLLLASCLQAPVVADRFGLGHWVYRQYKEGNLDKTWVYEFDSSIRRLRHEADSQLPYRDLEANHRRQLPEIHIFYMYTSPDQLNKQRQAAGKLYPYDEMFMYTQMANELLRSNSLVNLYYICMPLSNEELIERVRLHTK